MRENEFTAWLRSGAAELGASVNPPAPDAIRSQGDRRRRRLMVTSGLLAFAVGACGGGVAYASLGQPGSPASSSSGHPGTNGLPATTPVSAAPSGGPPSIVGLTTGGAVQVFSAVTGMATRTLVPKVDAVGDAVAVSPSGSTVYFAVKHGCTDYIESVPVAGGTPTVITTGVLPAISPDGTKLAFVREPFSGGLSPVQYGCLGNGAQPGKQFQVVVRDLTTGRQTVYPAPPGTATALPFPISHLSWAPSGKTLLVSVGPAQDNGGWGLSVLNIATARYYLPANWPSASRLNVPVTGQPSAEESYYREGVYLPGGGMFVDRVCCGGVPVRTSTISLEEVNASGQLIRHVAQGFTNRDHTSLDASGDWLLYLSAHDLFISDDAHAAYKLTSGLIAAAWLP